MNSYSKIVSITVKLNMGDPIKTETDIGPLIDEEAAIKVEMLVDDALNNGAELLLGGKRYWCILLSHGH